MGKLSLRLAALTAKEDVEIALFVAGIQRIVSGDYIMGGFAVVLAVGLILFDQLAGDGVEK
jgi:hypothetical protein